MAGGSRGQTSGQINSTRISQLDAPLARFVASADEDSTIGILDVVNEFSVFRAILVEEPIG